LDPRGLYGVEVVVLDGPCLRLHSFKLDEDGTVMLSEDRDDVLRREPYLRPMRALPPGCVLC